MQFTTLAALLFASTAIATPAYMNKRQAAVCAGTYGNAQCCATDVLGVADLNCVNPPTAVTSYDQFVQICADEGQQAKCCALPILGQALLCEDPTA